MLKRTTRETRNARRDIAGSFDEALGINADSRVGYLIPLSSDLQTDLRPFSVLMAPGNGEVGITPVRKAPLQANCSTHRWS
jgi:hypothetical protein